MVGFGYFSYAPYIFFSLSYLNIVVMVGDLKSKIYYSILQFAGFASFGVS